MQKLFREWWVEPAYQFLVGGDVGMWLMLNLLQQMHMANDIPIQPAETMGRTAGSSESRARQDFSLH